MVIPNRNIKWEKFNNTHTEKSDLLYRTFQSNLSQGKKERKYVLQKKNKKPKHIFEKKMVENFVAVRESIDPEVQESWQILNRIEKKTLWHIVKLLGTKDSRYKSGQKYITYRDPVQ